MTTKKTIDILDAALGVKGGKSQLIDLDGHELSVRKNFTGAEARAYIEVWRLDDPKTNAEVVKNTVDVLSDSDEETKAAFVERLMQETQMVVSKVLHRMGVLAGLRDEDGNFFPGSHA